MRAPLTSARWKEAGHTRSAAETSLLAFYSPAASAPRVRGSGAPSSPFGVTAIEFADVCPIGSTMR